MRLSQPAKMSCVAVFIASACAVAQPSAKIANPAFSGFKLYAQTVRTVQKNHSRAGLRQGDVFLYGVPGKPARIESPKLSLSARIIVLGAKSQNIMATCGHVPEVVKVKGEIVPRSGGLPLRFEVTCQQALFDGKKGVWTLEGTVKGFYETAKGRKPLSGDVVTLSRLDSTVSITQETTENAGGNQ